jgi:hypothetical protein
MVLRLKRPDEKQTRIYDLDSLAIMNIEIKEGETSLKFKKIKDVWTLVEPVTWRADDERMKLLFSTVLSAKHPKTAMGEGADAVKRYKLQDSEALHIYISNESGSKRIKTMFSNLGNPYDYFRYEGSDKVYQIKAKVVNIFKADLPNWRSPNVVNHNEEDLLRIDITHGKRSFSLTRVQYDWFYKDSREEFKIPDNNLGIMKVVNALANLNTYVFVDGGDKSYLDRFKTPDCVVTLQLTNNRTQELSFAKNSDDNYLMMVDKDESVLFMLSFDTVFRFMRHAEMFRSRAY